jgi:hypothetical protein
MGKVHVANGEPMKYLNERTSFIVPACVVSIQLNTRSQPVCQGIQRLAHGGLTIAPAIAYIPPMHTARNNGLRLTAPAL